MGIQKYPNSIAILFYDNDSISINHINAINTTQHKTEMKILKRLKYKVGEK